MHSYRRYSVRTAPYRTGCAPIRVTESWRTGPCTQITAERVCTSSQRPILAPQCTTSASAAHGAHQQAYCEACGHSTSLNTGTYGLEAAGAALGHRTLTRVPSTRCEYPNGCAPLRRKFGAYRGNYALMYVAHCLSCWTLGKGTYNQCLSL